MFGFIRKNDRGKTYFRKSKKILGKMSIFFDFFSGKSGFSLIFIGFSLIFHWFSHLAKMSDTFFKQLVLGRQLEPVGQFFLR